MNTVRLKIPPWFYKFNRAIRDFDFENYPPVYSSCILICTKGKKATTTKTKITSWITWFKPRIWHSCASCTHVLWIQIMHLSRTFKPSSCLRCYYCPLDRRIAITIGHHCLISKWNLFRIDHFRVASSLCFKARLSVKPLIWKWFFILMHLKLVFSNKCFALSLVLKVTVFGTRKWLFRSCN